MSTPSIDALPTTPAHEWTESTTNALAEQPEQPPSLQRTISTPGPQLPGAYPRTTEDVKPIDTSALKPQNVLNTAKHYLPQVVTSYFEGVQPESKEPSTNNQNETVERSDSIKDSAITEPESVTNLSTRAVAGSSVGSQSSSLATPTASTVVSEFTAEPPQASHSASTLDGQKVLSSLESNNTDNVKLKNASTIADQGHEQQPMSASPETLPAFDTSTTLNSGSKFPESTPEAKSSNSSGSGISNGASAKNTTSSPSKSKFLDKIKGEVKVISGKLGKNEEKIEQGKRLLGKA